VRRAAILKGEAGIGRKKKDILFDDFIREAKRSESADPDDDELEAL
jgi:hypothetical protein